ncbi:uncharacterized protein LOC124681201 isoform X4 [Lolium rigidum]|uniref:uncharacterized protein LOC124681201 isoform X4 n=1 Tax=Lolium rigidum TaxID=89674 RepID=UPI001F5DDCDD|nr:uncharacterized protein LOC124681201 isoform X4 [Lolium rigidum]
MVEMEDEEKRKPLVVGLTRRHVIRSSPPSPAADSPAALDSNRNESEGGDHIAEFRRKKGKKPKAPLKWRSTNSDMNNRNGGETERSDRDRGEDDIILSSLAAAGSSFSGLISSRKTVRTLGKVAEGCDAADPPVPRKLRSAINKRTGRNASSSPRHAKKRRHLSAISAQIFLMDHETRTSETTTSNSFTQEEEVLADTLLALSQNPHVCEATAAEMRTGEDISSVNIASTSCSEGAMKEVNKLIVSRTDDDEAVIRPAPVDQQVEQNGSVPQKNPDLNAPHNSIILHFSKDGQKQDLSLGIDTILSSPSTVSSNNSARKQPKLQFNGSLSLANPTKSEAPHWLVKCSKPGFAVHDGTKDENNSVQEVMPPVRTPLPCTSKAYSTNLSSSTSGALSKPATETSKASASENNPKLSLSKTGEPTKTWKKSITHVYVSHLIQAHLDKEKALQNLVKPEESSRSCMLTTSSSSTMNKNKAHFDARHPVQQSLGFRDVAAGRQKMVGSNNLNMATSAGFSGAQYVQYLHHPQMIVHRGPTPYPYPHHLPCSRGNIAPTLTVQQQMQQYMCNPGYAPHPGQQAIPSTMKLQQFAPTPQQEQQMWQFHFAQYHQPRPAEGGVPVSWQNSRLQDISSSSLRPMLAPRPPAAMMPPPQVELLCAPYQGGGGGRRPPQLRLI